MNIGIPKEVKTLEARVSLIPHAVATLVKAGHQVWVEKGAGQGAGFSDEAYQLNGATLVSSAKELYKKAVLIVKVKEPQQEEYALIESHHILFGYLHLAAYPELTDVLLKSGATAIAFETVSEGGTLPLLAPMSEIAGRIGAMAGAHYLHASMGGKGVLLGGVPGVGSGRAVVLGAGVAGTAAIDVLARLGAQVTVFDKKPEALKRIFAMGNNIEALYAYEEAIQESVRDADLVIGAVLLPGAKAPCVVDESTVKAMAPGSVIVDISIDQGGCIATSRATDYKKPTYEKHGILHFAVTNIPSGVPSAASSALSAAITPYVIDIADKYCDEWLKTGSAGGVNVYRGELLISLE